MPLILSKQHKNVIFLALVPRPTILVWLSIKVLFAKVSKRFSWHIVYTYTLYKKTSWEWIQEKYIARRGYLNTILKSIFENQYKTFFKNFSLVLFYLNFICYSRQVRSLKQSISKVIFSLQFTNVSLLSTKACWQIEDLIWSSYLVWIYIYKYKYVRVLELCIKYQKMVSKTSRSLKTIDDWCQKSNQIHSAIKNFKEK